MTILPPKLPECEAVMQEITALQTHFGGDLVYLNPNQSSPIYIPRPLFGFHKLLHLRKQEKQIDMHHLFNPDPFPFVMLRFLKKPIIYSLSSGIGNACPPIKFLRSLSAITVSDERSFKRLHAWGIENVFLIQPGIDARQFTFSPLPLDSTIRLMVGSAPWTMAQFESKGINILLKVAQRNPGIHLVFLWRHVYFEEMRKRVQQANLDKQVTILNERVDVNQVLANVHASITLATVSTIIRPYPHSLMESLTAGKPIIISHSIPMSDYILRHGGGIVLDNIQVDDILSAIEQLIYNYDTLQRQTHQADFSQSHKIAEFQTVYEHVCS